MNQISKNLQSDIVKIAGKKIFINPFLYSRKLDQKTKNWLKDIRQISDSVIFENRSRFYPELEWNKLTENEKSILNATIEMFLKTLKIIETFHPNLTLKQLNIVEKNLIILKKNFFEKWVKRQFKKKAKLILKEKRKSERVESIKSWQKWLSQIKTKQLFIPIFFVILLAALLGWFAGVSKNSCNPYFENNTMNRL